jgi:hypothetical protein
MKKSNKFIIVFVSIPLVILLFFASNIKGYYHFKSMCEQEGGLRVYEKLEKNVGWWAKDKYDARVVALLTGVGFVRFTDKKDGQIYDINYLGGAMNEDSSYEIVISDQLQEVRYRWNSISLFSDDAKRLKKSGYEILDERSGKKVAGYYSFYFSAHAGNLGGPDWQSCTNEDAKVDNWQKAFNSIFKN